jgi:uncharacterized oligopeptide transporter (OPT) family protein
MLISIDYNVDSQAVWMSLLRRNWMASTQPDIPDTMSTHSSNLLDVADRRLGSSHSHDEIRMSSARRELDDRPTLRALSAGLVVGILVCVCNIYFALQTGWGSGMTLPSALIGFVLFRILSPLLRTPFTIAENVLVATVAAATGTVCLGSGFTGVIPALDFLLQSEEGAPLDLNLGRLTVWSLGTCAVGAVFAPVLWDQMILKEKLPFPTGTATAALISTLHEEKAVSQQIRATRLELEDAETQNLLHDENEETPRNESFIGQDIPETAHQPENQRIFTSTQQLRPRSLLFAVLVSAAFVGLRVHQYWKLCI